MASLSLTDALFADLSATAVPAQTLAHNPQSFSVKRLNPLSGRALECLAHAIEYLEDTTPYRTQDTPEIMAADDAVRILKTLNREIFAQLPIALRRRSLLQTIVAGWESGR